MANLYLSSGDNLSGLTFGGNVFGAAGSESVSYTGAATGIVVDQNVEEVKLANATSAYSYQQQGNQLVILSGTTVVATIGVQGDANGTLISFANGRVEAKFVPGTPPTITLGGTTVPTTAGPVVPAVIDGSGGTGSQTLVLTAGPDTLTGSGGADIFNALPVNASGVAATTLSDFDTLDGGTGEDTLNIYTTGANNTTLPATFAAKNIEIVNVFNAGAAAALGDVSKYGAELKQFNQNVAAAAVTNLGATQTAGFKSVNSAISVAPTAAAASVNIALESYGEGNTITVDGSAATSTLNAVTVSGTVKDTNVDGTIAATTVAVTAGKDVQTLSVNSALKTTLTVTKNAASTKDITTVDASASAGAITYVAATTVTTVKSGAGNDVITIQTATLKDDTATTTVDETVSALVETGAGKDTINIATTGTGATTVNAGDGDDTVNLNDRGTGKLTVNLGAGNDTFNVAVGKAVSAGDVIDGGDGKDTLLLSIVGASNIASFSNFEVFDAKGLNAALDVDILASKNTVTEFVTTGALGAAAELINVGAGVGYRVTADTDANDIVFTQKTGGALTITLDIDEPATTVAGTTTAATDRDATVTATNATAITAVFDSAFFDKATGVGDNATDLNITGTKATALTITSGGANAVNNLDYTVGDGTSAGLLSTVTITGTQALTLNLIEGAKASSVGVDASGLSGALTFDLLDLKAASAATTFDGGVIKLGTGADILTAAVAGGLAKNSTVVGIQKGTAEDLTAAGVADTIKITGAVQAADVTTGTYTVKDGLLTFLGAGPATLTDAFNTAKTVAAVNEALVFNYLGDSYIFAEGADNAVATDDVLIKLQGTTGLAGLDTYAANSVYVF